VKARFLDAAAHTAFEHAIRTIEGGSAVEIVIAVRRRSGAYRHANVVIGGAVAIAALAIMLFSEPVFGLGSILVDPFVLGAIAGALVELAPELKRALTPASLRHHAVARAARATFVERGVHNTRDRSGLLVYISWLERQVVLVPDSGLAKQLSLEPAQLALTQALSKGGAAVAGALEQLAPRLAEAMPRRDDDRNELPDAIDSDLERRPRARGPRL
jgi:putative membrane protein